MGSNSYRKIAKHTFQENKIILKKKELLNFMRRMMMQEFCDNNFKLIFISNQVKYLFIIPN